MEFRRNKQQPETSRHKQLNLNNANKFHITKVISGHGDNNTKLLNIITCITQIVILHQLYIYYIWYPDNSIEIHTLYLNDPKAQQFQVSGYCLVTTTIGSLQPWNHQVVITTKLMPTLLKESQVIGESTRGGRDRVPVWCCLQCVRDLHPKCFIAEFSRLIEFCIEYFLALNEVSYTKKYANISSSINNLRISFVFSTPRVIRTSALERRAELEMESARARQQSSRDALLFRVPQQLKWGPEKNPEKTLHASAIAQGFAGRELPWSNPKRDQIMMHRFCDAILFMDRFYGFGSETIDSLLVSKAPLVDFLGVLQRRPDVWGPGVLERELILHIQMHRGISLALVNQVKVMEIVVSRSTPAHIEEVRQFILVNHERNQKDCPTGVMSMDVEMFKVKHKCSLYITNQQEYEGAEYCLDLDFKAKEPCANLPVKFMIGDGQTWAVMVSVPVDVREGKTFIPKLYYQPELMELLQELPIFTGLGVDNDVLSKENFVRQVSGNESFSFRGYVDLSAYALAARYNLPFTNMPIMAYHVLGSAMNKRTSCGDNKWGRPWDEIPDALKAYCLGDIKFGYQTVVVFYGLLINHLFPDPDIVLSVLRCSHAEFGRWFGRWIRTTLFGIEVDNRQMEGATTYAELLKNTMYYRTSEGRPSTITPSRIMILIEVAGPYPALTCGGARFIHEARYYTLKALAILEKTEVHQWYEFRPKGLNLFDPEKMEAALYGVSNVKSFDYGAPVNTKYGLEVHPEILKHSVVKNNPFSIGYDEVLRVATLGKRIVRETVMEWVRFHVGQHQFVLSYLDSIQGDPHYYSYLGSYYMEARMIYLRCTGEEAPRVDHIEEEMQARNAHSIQKETKKITELDADVEEIERKIQWLQIELHEKRLARRDLLERVEFLEEQRPENKKRFPNKTWRGQLPEVFGQERDGPKGSRRDQVPIGYEGLVDDLKKDARKVEQFAELEQDEYPTLGRYPRAKKSKGRKRKGSFIHNPSLAKIWNPDPSESDEDDQEERLITYRADSTEVQSFTLG